MLLGEVVSFDVHRGDGWLRSSDGEELYFHCVTIADGTRQVPVGATVRASRVVGHLGVDEASAIRIVD
jgi:cold shock CspA family protein